MKSQNLIVLTNLIGRQFILDSNRIKYMKRDVTDTFTRLVLNCGEEIKCKESPDEIIKNKSNDC